MKKRLLIPMLVAIAGLVFVFSASAFKKTSPVDVKAKPVLTTYYYMYTPANNFAEADYETVGNWSYVGTSAGSDPCSGFNARPCVIHADLTTGSNATSDLVNFLIAQPSAKTYAETATNISHQKP